MTPAPARDLKVGKIINKTLDVLEKNVATVVLVVVVLAAVNTGMGYLALSKTAVMQTVGITLANAVISILASFFIYNALLRKIGLDTPAGGALLLPFVGLSLLYSLGVMIGFILIIIPGLFFMARWSIAQPMLLADKKGIMQSLGESWEQTKGNEFAIILAALALSVLFIAITLYAQFQIGADTLLGLAISSLSGAVMSVIFAAMSVALYALIMVARNIEGVFD